MSSKDSSRPKKASKPHFRLARVVIPLWRLSILIAACWCLHHVYTQRKAAQSNQLDPAWIEQAQQWLPSAQAFGEPQANDPLTAIYDAEETTIGWATQTYPEAASIPGYAGSSNLLIIFNRNREVLGTQLLFSEDTAGHVQLIEKSPAFFSQWNGKHSASLNQHNDTTVVSSATLTSDAIARGIAARFGATDAAEWFPEPLTLEQVKSIFPDASGFVETKPGVYQVGREAGTTILRSSEMGVSVHGFQGPSDIIVGLNGNTVVGVRMIGSRDNEPYILDVAEELKYTEVYDGLTQPANAENDLLVVSGASYTARSIDRAVDEMLRRYLQVPTAKPIDWKLIVGMIWLMLGLIIALSPLRKSRKLRLAFAIFSIGVGGLWLGWMVAQDQWITWAERGTLSGTSLALLILSAVAIIVPSIFGKNIYCSHICPHGAAQTLLGNLRKRRFALPAKLHKVMVTVPWLSLILLWILALVGSSFSASLAEPFEIWSTGFYAILPTVIFGTGLIAAIFLPQAYCHYGCPTGALLKFLTHSPSHWTRRDTIALILVCAAWSSTFILA